MIRDPGPIHNLGYSVTSRDIPFNEGETDGSAPNSGYVTKALNGHPVMRFFASTAATIAATVVASKLTKAGGLRLGKFLQDSADSGSTVSTRIVKAATDIRRELDELQGVHRQMDDPYSKLVHLQEGKYTTGYEGVKSERYGFRFLTEEDRRVSGKGSLYETPATWSYKDELQVRLIRAGRRLPYELPAMYGVQKAITEPLFGQRDENERKVKWYNPVDVVADFTKQSVTNIATMIMPFEFAGAGMSQARNSLHTLRYSMNDMASLTPRQKLAHRGYVNVTDLLAEVGHDFATMTNKFLRSSSQVSGALSAASQDYAENQQGFVQTLYSLRKGVEKARAAQSSSSSSRKQLRDVTFSAAFKGYKDPTTGQAHKTVTDLIPAFSGLGSAIKKGVDEFRLLGKAHDAMESSIAFNKVLSSTKGIKVTGDDLLEGINRIQSQHSSRLSSLATGVRRLGGGGPGTASFTRGDFNRGRQTDAYKQLLEQQLISNGASTTDARKFLQYIDVRIPRSNMNATNIITIGKTKIIDPNDSDYFNQILQRYRQIDTKGTFESAISGDALRKSVEEARSVFTNRDFQKSLKTTIQSDWNAFYDKHLTQIASTVLKPQKATYQDFTGPLSAAKQEFLQRKTAQVLGINLIKEDGSQVASNIINKQLAQQGFDPTNFVDMRAFLIRNRQMSSGIMSGGFNLFGLKPLTVDEASASGRFKYLPKEEQKIIADISGRMRINDPVSSAIGMSRLDGMYKTRSGEIVDFSSIKTTFSNVGNFFAGQFKIPILGFNPADLFGYRSFAEMRKASPIQYVSSRSIQPFLPGASAETRPNFYMWYKGKGSKGKVLSFSRSDTGVLRSEQLAGTYRPIPTASNDLLTRHARYGSGIKASSTDQVRAQMAIDSGEDLTSGSRFLDRLMGPERALRFKKAFDVDAEQPNSLFGLGKRFAQRKSDLQNTGVMSRLARGDELDYNYKGKNIKIKIDETDLTVKDAASGNIVDDFTRADVLRGYETLRKETFNYGFNQPIMEALEEADQTLFTFFGQKVSRIKSPQEAVDFAEQVIAGIDPLKQRFRSLGIDPQFLETSASRMQNLINNGNLTALSKMAEKSPTITTRLDELKNEIFRYVSQVNQVQRLGSSTDIFVQMTKAVDDLVKQGTISVAQKSEAQAAALSTLFNMSAFKTFNHATSSGLNHDNALREVLSTLRSSSEVKKLVQPFAEGRIAEVSGGGTRRRLSSLLSPLKKQFGVAKYQMDDMAVDELGAKGQATLVPTFGTVFERNPYGAIKSALGFTTYSDPGSFSTGSMPISQGVERLNRYFGTLGMQLDVSQYKGPLDLYMRGMVAKRVLPIYGAGVTALTVDRTLGGMVSGEDERGERIYKPLVLSQVAKAGVEMQAAASGLTPGGMTYEEKKEQLVEGEVPIRQGRFWPLGNTPFKGGKVMYYRPSWYRKLQGGAAFTSDLYGSPAEKFLFYNDISPLRPFDPYRFERKHYEDRPYPVTGEYFSGPFGPAVPLLNMTVGKILKPQKTMHQQELAAGLSAYAPAGEFGAFNTQAYIQSGMPITGPTFAQGPGIVGAAPVGFGGSAPISSMSAQNQEMASRAGALNTAANLNRGYLSDVNNQYIAAAYGPPKVSGVMNPRIVPAGAPLEPSNLTFQASEFGYRMQEMAGIYGFGFASMREKFGFGQGDFEPQRAVLQSASKAYGTSRAFWDLNLGGLGDVPIPSREAIGNIEFSEIVRRFIPKERTNVDYINPIPNLMGKQYPFLPGPEYFTDFSTGDPFAKVQEGEIRLPGVAYERFNTLYGDETGRYGKVNQLDILADVAPYSKKFKTLNRQIDREDLSPEERIKVQEIRAQVENTTKKYDFSEYKYRDVPGSGPVNLAGRMGEYIAHSDNFVLSKIFGKRTALEDWERRNVYGATFPEWQRPIESYINPMLQKATQENPVVAAASLGFVGSMFGRTPGAKLFGTVVGVAAGAGSSIYGNAYEAVTGDRYIPAERKKELALEEYTDILNYVKNTRLASMARESGDMRAAVQYKMAAKRTMYGADIYGADVETLSLAIPKRKREHFKAMIDAPESERGRILSTAGRLERRIYEAAWGMDVEKRPELDEYFSRHELPDASWEGWHPNTNIDAVKIKMGQSMGLEMSQMGYYPQQIKEANLLNPSYPTFNMRQDRQDVLYRLRALMSARGLTGSVSESMNPFGSEQMSISAGVR